MTLLFLSDIAWDSLYQRPQHLAAQLSRSTRVLWIEPMTLGRQVILSPVQLIPGLYRMTLPAFPFNARNRWIKQIAGLAVSLGALRWVVDRLQNALLRRGLRKIGAAKDHIVCLVENFMLMHLADAVSSRRVVFDYIDDVFGFTALPPAVHSAWLAAVQRADSITVTSPTLRKRIRDANPREVQIVRNGVEFTRFAGTAGVRRPSDFPPQGSPVVGYVGSVYPWLDFSLLDNTIGAMTECNFVMVGPVHPSVEGEIARLARHRNFRFLGLKPYGAVPAYMRNLDVALIPFKRTLLTEGVNPVKLYEYSAAGVPTVATDFSEDTREFAGIVLIAHSEAEFVTHIREALRLREDHDFTGKLGAFAAENDWDCRVREFSDLLQLEGS